MPFRTAYVRGLSAYLADTGMLKVAQTEEEANAIADAVANAVDESKNEDIANKAVEEAVSGEATPTALDAEDIAELADAISDIAAKAEEAKEVVASANPMEIQKLAASGPTPFPHINIALTTFVQEKNAQAASGIGRGNANVEGSMIDSTPQNPMTPPSAATRDPVADMEYQQRPQGYAVQGVQGVGTTQTNLGMGAGMIGTQTKHPNQPANTAPEKSDVTSNPAQKMAEEVYRVKFRKCAEKVLPFLPKEWSAQQKVAAINDMIDKSDEEKAEMLAAAENLEFERAAALRDRIAALKDQGQEAAETAVATKLRPRGRRRGRRRRR